MRILIVGINFAPEPTGIGKYTGEMSQWLATRGHEVDVITALPHYPAWSIDPAYQGAGYMREHVRGVDIRRSPLYTPGANDVRARHRIALETTFNLASLRWWLPQFAAPRPDVVVSICPPLQVSLVPLAYSRLRNVPWLVHIQDLQVDAALRLGIVGSQRAADVLYACERAVLERASFVTAISRSMRDRIIEKGVPAERVGVFPNWADTDFIAPRDPDPTFRRALGAVDGDTLVMYSGIMGTKQGLDIVLDAAERLRNERHIRFAMIGEGTMKKRLEDQAAARKLDAIRFHDLVPWRDVPALLSAGDVHLVPQEPEAADLVMPSKLTNILAAGRASVVTASEGTELYNVIGAFGLGLVTPPRDAVRFAEAIRTLASDERVRQRLGESARAYAERHLRADRVLLEFEKVLATLSTSVERGA